MPTRSASASRPRARSTRAAIAGVLASLACAAPPMRAALVTDGEIVSMDNYTVSDRRFSLPLSTAARLPLTPRETPQSVASVDRLRLDLESLFSVNEVMQTITGVHVSFYDSQRPLYFARGFQITDFQVDGVPTYSGSTNQDTTPPSTNASKWCVAPTAC